MNSDFSDSMDASLLRLERELQSLTPAAPGRELVRSLSARMEPVPRTVQTNKVHTFPWRRVVTPAAAAAAAVAVMSFQNNRRNEVVADKPGVADQDEAPPAITWEPMPLRREYRELLDKGFVFDENFEPVQQFLMNSVDHHEWRNAAGNSSIRLTIPRQQRLLFPAGYEGDQSGPDNRLQFR